MSNKNKTYKFFAQNLEAIIKKINRKDVCEWITEI